MSVRPLALLVFLVLPFGGGTIFAQSLPAELGQYERNAAHGDIEAMLELGLAYHRGEGVPQDYARAMDWYLKAYAKKDGDAFNNIGVMYRDGLGVPKNEKVAYLLFLAVHMEGLGTEGTQYRAGRNLSRLAESLPKEAIFEALSYTWAYVDQIVRSKGSNIDIGKDVLPSRSRLRIRDNGWWLDSERKGMDFPSPPPWNKISKQKEPVACLRKGGSYRPIRS